MWAKSDSARLCFGANADVCLGRSGPGELSTFGGTVVARVAASERSNTCDADHAGELQYAAEDKKLRVCDGSGEWVATGSDANRDAESFPRVGFLQSSFPT